jgi:Tfp pilus assembly protein PilV
MVALALLAMSIMAAGSLSVLAARTNVESGHRSQATALGTRELEAVRKYRDTQVITPGKTWLDVFPNGCSTFTMKETSGLWSRQVSGSPVGFSSAEFSANPQPEDFGAYYRLVKACDAAGDPKYKNVEVTVYWQEGNGGDYGIVTGVTLNRKLTMRTLLVAPSTMP